MDTSQLPGTGHLPALAWLHHPYGALRPLPPPIAPQVPGVSSSHPQRGKTVKTSRVYFSRESLAPSIIPQEPVSNCVETCSSGSLCLPSSRGSLACRLSLEGPWWRLTFRVPREPAGNAGGLGIASGSSPSSASCCLGSPGQVTLSVCASVSSAVKWR